MRVRIDMQSISGEANSSPHYVRERNFLGNGGKIRAGYNVFVVDGLFNKRCKHQSMRLHPTFRMDQSCYAART